MTATGGDEGRLIIGSRRSRLARAQAEWVGDRLQESWPGLEVEYLAMSTAGDRDPDTPLPDIGVKGLFTADLETALSEKRVDLLVHSLKDLPTDAPGDATLAAIPVREDPRDVLVLRGDLAIGGDWRTQAPAGLRIGTSSVRRAAQVRRWIEEVSVEPVRGNVETRLSKVEEGALDGVVLAAAGLRRLGIQPPGLITLEPPAWLPAPGQGALALQGRDGDVRVERLVRSLHDPGTASSVRAERQLLARLEGGCHVPVAALATLTGDGLRLDAAVYPEDPGDDVLTGSAVGAVGEATRMGRRLAEDLLRAGARHLV